MVKMMTMMRTITTSLTLSNGSFSGLDQLQNSLCQPAVLLSLNLSAAPMIINIIVWELQKIHTEKVPMFSGQIFQDWSFWTISSEANHCIGCKSGHHLVPLALSYCPIYQLILCRSHGYYVNTNTKCPWRITKNYDSLVIPKTRQERKGVDRLGECGVSRIGGKQGGGPWGDISYWQTFTLSHLHASQPHELWQPSSHDICSNARRKFSFGLGLCKCAAAPYIWRGTVDREFSVEQ